jgi:hypothetical protein
MKTMTMGVIPHQLFVIKRDVAVAAVDKAYERILKSDEKFLNSADLAIAFEIQLAAGWTYNPGIMYNWYDTSTGSASHTKNMASRFELFSYYTNLAGSI